MGSHVRRDGPHDNAGARVCSFRNEGHRKSQHTQMELTSLSCVRSDAAERLVPPVLSRFLGLAQNGLSLLGRLDLHEIALHWAHSIVKAPGQEVDLEELLRQVAARVGKMQHAPWSISFLDRS